MPFSSVPLCLTAAAAGTVLLASTGGASVVVPVRRGVAMVDVDDLPVGPFPPVVIPGAPRPYWSWDRIPRSYHGAVKDRTFSDEEVALLAKFQMLTIEKWYTPCGSQGPTQSGPGCAVEQKHERLFERVRNITGPDNITANLYWNSMFAFSMYSAYQGMLDLEATGVHAFLRDETGTVISLCNDGNVYCNITSYDWTEPEVRALWVNTIVNGTKYGIDGIFADHSAQIGIQIGNTARNGQAPNQLCNGKGAGRRCFNFTDAFRDSFNAWHTWGTNYTQALLSNLTGGPVIQGPLASMNQIGNLTDPNYCDFEAIRQAQATSGMAVFEARGSCKPTEDCIAAFLAAVEPGTYMHCVYNGDDLLSEASFPQIDAPLGAPNGSAVETPPGSNVWRRFFASGTVVEWDQNKKTGQVTWAPVPPAPAPAPAPGPAPPAYCGETLQNTGLARHDLGGEVVTASLADCCARCHEKSACQAYAWHHGDGGNTCHFHTREASPHAVTGCFSAFVNGSAHRT